MLASQQYPEKSGIAILIYREGIQEGVNQKGPPSAGWGRSAQDTFATKELSRSTETVKLHKSLKKGMLGLD